MTDSDARVAAPDVQQMAEQWHDNETLGGFECDHRALEITAYKAGYAAAIRAELQKPALHEPVAVVKSYSESELTAVVTLTPRVNGLSPVDVGDALFLQGRAKPATEAMKCKGRECSAVNGDGHSAACHEEHNTIVMAGLSAEDNPHDRRTAMNAYTQWENDRLAAIIHASKGEKT